MTDRTEPFTLAVEEERLVDLRERRSWESFGDQDAFAPVQVPAGLSIFPKEIFPASRRWAEHRLPDLRHYRVLDRGGHFAAFEWPDAFVDEVRTFFALVRD
jgi:hypothetical protein